MVPGNKEVVKKKKKEKENQKPTLPQPCKPKTITNGLSFQKQ
jgi:hypothetical protein